VKKKEDITGLCKNVSHTDFLSRIIKKGNKKLLKNELNKNFNPLKTD
jgi:hypothetical protein